MTLIGMSDSCLSLRSDGKRSTACLVFAIAPGNLLDHDATIPESTRRMGRAGKPENPTGG
jgi:hypothetical protein